MTAPVPDDGAPPRDAVVPTGEFGRGRSLLARKWAYVISTTTYLPLTHTEVEQHMLHLVNRLFDTVLSEPFDPAPAAGVGARLVEMQCVGKDSIRRSAEVLGKALLGQPELDVLERPAERVIAVLGEMMAGYSETLRDVTQRRQEGLNQSLLSAAEDARRSGPVGRANFEEVFRSSSSGIAVLGLDGRFRHVNEAVGVVFGRPVAELTLPEVVDPGDAELIRAAWASLVTGEIAHLSERAQVTREDGSRTHVSLSAALVRDAGGRPEHVVAVVEEDSEISLLRRRLAYQALHDTLTGLPNRQSFRAELGETLERADPATGITLYHLDLDGFSLIAGGHGDEIADRLLQHVAESLKSVMARETAVVARLGADEFGILVENTVATPAVPSMVERLAEALSEPVFLDGEHGLATSASIGVVHRPDPGTPPAELLLAAERTLRRAKSGGHGQWLLSDPELDAEDRETAALAASMPGALETGEIQVVYRPVVRLDGGRRVAIEALVRWDHPHHGPFSHDQCLALAEPTGLILDLGGWLLSSACQRLRGEDEELRLSIVLTRSQAADPDLVAVVRRILGETGLRPERLVLAFPGGPLGESEETAENLSVLSEIGVNTIVEGFGAVGDVLFLEDLPVSGIRIDRRLVARQAERPAPESPTMRMLATAIEFARQAGMRVSVDGVDTEEQAAFWRAAGVDYALGDLFGRHTQS